MNNDIKPLMEDIVKLTGNSVDLHLDDNGDWWSTGWFTFIGPHFLATRTGKGRNPVDALRDCRRQLEELKAKHVRQAT